MFQNKLTGRLLIAAGAMVLVALACDGPGGAAPSATPPPTVEPPTAVSITGPTLSPDDRPCGATPPDASIPDGPSWGLYCDEILGFAFFVPPATPGTAAPLNDNTKNVYLPFTAGTNLAEKYLALTTVEGATTCESPQAASAISSESVNINGIDWYKQTGSDAGAGNSYDWVGYSNLHGELCLSMTFIMHSNSPGAFTTPPPEFDKAAESVVIDQVMATFGFRPPTPMTGGAGGETCATNPPDPSIPDAASWQLYCDEVHGFAFRYPAGGSPGGGAGHGSIYLPFSAGTNIAEKYISVVFQEGVTTCQSPNAEGYEPGSIPSETVSINGIDWFKQSGSDAGAGNFYDWVGFSTLRGEACLSLTFIIHSNNPGVFETPPAEYDPAAETAVYDQIMATLLWP